MRTQDERPPGTATPDRSRRAPPLSLDPTLGTATHDAPRSGATEAARLEAVRRHEILDTPPDGAFDQVTALAAMLLGVPVAVISIVDEDRIWFKSRHGLDVEETDRGPGLCASAILQDGLYVIPDTLRHPEAFNNALVRAELGVRFYAAVPLATSDGHNLGTLCVIDVRPRELSDRDGTILCALAGLVVRELELRLATRTAVSREALLREEAVVERRRAAELAETLQRSLLPHALPKIPGVALAGRFRPFDRSQVGGDFYDVFPLPDGAWGLVIGDVCGKGSEAAALTAAARYTIRSAALEHESPADALHAVNAALLIDREDHRRYCTLAYARLRPVGGRAELVLACGGHPPPRILRRAGGVEQMSTSGTLVGVFDDAEFSDRTATLNPGDSLVLFTDGLTESPTGHSGSELLGPEGVDAMLRTCRGRGADRIADCLQDAARPTRDDLAVVVARVAA